MPHRYRLIAALLVATLLLTACGGQPAAENAPEPTDATAEATAVPASEEPTTAPDGAATDATAAPAAELREETPEDADDEGEAEAPAEGFPLTITDGAGRELTFAAPPERIVCPDNYCIVTLIDLGLKPFAIPETFIDDPSPVLLETPGGLSDIEIIPLEDGLPSLEVIVSLEPDLVIIPEEFATPLEGIFPTFVGLPLFAYEDLFENLPRYGQLFDREAEAEMAIAAFQERVNAYRNAVPRNDLTIMNFASIDESNPSGGELAVRSTNAPDCALLNRILRCPYEDPLANSSSWSFPTNVEYVLEQDPDVFLIPVQGRPLEEVRAELESDPLWRELSAIQNDRLILTDVDLGAGGLADAAFLLDTVMPLIFPDGPLTDQEVQEILSEQ